jgi:hypothetical protein
MVVIKNGVQHGRRMLSTKRVVATEKRKEFEKYKEYEEFKEAVRSGRNGVRVSKEACSFATKWDLLVSGISRMRPHKSHPAADPTLDQMSVRHYAEPATLLAPGF